MTHAPDVVDWFERRTWHHTDFAPVELADRLAELGERVSVVIPARNEEDTVGAVVASLAPLTGTLVHEVLVVDGDSTDATVARAEGAGARVVAQGEVLRHAGPGRGKGDALWKGLASSEAELVVFLDADLRDPAPHYVTGLIGPLLVEPDVGFVKACYDRPLRVGSELVPHGGGRVTELLARPLLAAFWPQLGGVAQPLSGEYAGRRSVLEQVPFVEGYGVEIGLLIDLCDRFGVDAIGQTDLGRRSHTHQPLEALSRMAAEILHVAATRLSSEGRLDGGVGDRLAQAVRVPGGRFELRVSDVDVSERPPLRDELAPS